MKKYTFLNKISLLLVAMIATSCDGLFIPDPIDPRLPKYTENGNNVGGALINNRAWSSVVEFGLYEYYNLPYITSYTSSDSLVIQFFGELSDADATLEFHLTGLNINNIEGLLTLKGKKIQLDGINNSGVYLHNCTSLYYEHNPSDNQTHMEAYNQGKGQIYFKHASIDDLSEKLILSGTFGFVVQDSVGIETGIYYGRFDYKFTEGENFEVK